MQLQPIKKLNEEELLKIKQLNSRLSNEEARIKLFAEDCSVLLNQQKQQKLVDDYIFSASLSVFSNDSAVNKKYGLDIEEPIFEDAVYKLFEQNQSNFFYEDDWNEWQTFIPLKPDRMCYTMHAIINHSILTFEDILTIEEVWIKLNIEYRFYSK